MHSILRPETPLYRIESLLGEGLSSVVYRALKADARGRFKHSVAIKMLKNIKDLQHMREEFSTLTKIRSKHCVGIWGWEHFDQGPALILEYVDGISLEKLSRRGLDISLIDEIVAQIQSGLKAIHEQNVFHGDLSPHNILVGRDGILKLVDFGLSFRNENVAKLGTPGFVAPERLSGGLPSANGDKYSLGLIYHWLCEQSGIELTNIETTNNVSTLMRLTPNQREFANFESSLHQQRRLAQLVQATLAPKSQRTMKLTVLGAPSIFIQMWKQRKQMLTIGSSVVGVVGLLIYLLSSGFVKSKGTLRVRSNDWVHIELDQRELGYSPLDVNLVAGDYKIQWRTATRKGEMPVSIQKNQEVELHDKDFH